MIQKHVVEFKPYQVTDDTWGIAIHINMIESWYVLWVDPVAKRVSKTNRKGFGWKGSKSQAIEGCRMLAVDYFEGKIQ